MTNSSTLPDRPDIFSFDRMNCYHEEFYKQKYRCNAAQYSCRTGLGDIQEKTPIHIQFVMQNIHQILRLSCKKWMWMSFFLCIGEEFVVRGLESFASPYYTSSQREIARGSGTSSSGLGGAVDHSASATTLLQDAVEGYYEESAAFSEKFGFSDSYGLAPELDAQDSGHLPHLFRGDIVTAMKLNKNYGVLKRYILNCYMNL